MAYSGEKKKEYQRQWKQKRRVQWLEENGPCVLCGSDEDMQIDHIDPDQKVDHKIWSWSKARREAELAKCQILCYSCHKKKTEKERRPPHGTNSRYTSKKFRCRCDLCREAHRLVARGELDSRSLVR